MKICNVGGRNGHRQETRKDIMVLLVKIYGKCMQTRASASILCHTNNFLDPEPQTALSMDSPPVQHPDIPPLRPLTHLGSQAGQEGERSCEK